MFDVISYSKGASIIRMLQHFLDSLQPGYFRDGLRRYIHTHKYGSGTNIDLWNALQEVRPGQQARSSTFCARNA